MKQSNMGRRDFLQMIGMGTIVAGTGLTLPHVVSETEKGIILESETEYGKFWVEKLKNGKKIYKYRTKTLQPMSQKMTVFSRNRWDPSRVNRPEVNQDLTKFNLVENGGQIPNQSRLDYSLMAASWVLANSQTTPSYEWEPQSYQIKRIRELCPNPWQPEGNQMTWEGATLAVKNASLFYGASLVGIASLNPLWLYGDRYAPKKGDRERTIPVVFSEDRFEKTEEANYIPRTMNRVIALAYEMDSVALQNSPGRLASAATGNGYSRMAFTSFTLAEFIRGLGYNAIPAGNGFGLSIPMAIDAGLGELGRNGLLITPKYGPRVRISKVITDMPLISDTPIRFGVKEFCDVCKLCATHCPSGSIPKAKPSWKGKSPSNNPGVLKWYIQPESCFDYNGFSCSNCQRMCPFNKPNNSWLHQLTRYVVNGKIKPMDKMMVAFDQASGYGHQAPSDIFWKKKHSHWISARDIT